MSEVDVQAWLGKTNRCKDELNPAHARLIALSLDEAAPAAGDELPLLWHWACFDYLMAAPYAQLGRDGHPKTGGFLPPAGTRNRMWAGGRVQFLQALKIGVAAERRSRVANITAKEGRSGQLLFVTVHHEFHQAGALCISEEQDIVYREPAPPRLQGSKKAPTAEWSQTREPTSTLLFRYSAVTFNGHRIHYDVPYAREVEGYPGLVVHGPLIATFMLSACVHANPGRRVAHFAYRGLRPLIAPRGFSVAGQLDAGGAQVWAEQDGMLAHQGEVQFKG